MSDLISDHRQVVPFVRELAVHGDRVALVAGDHHLTYRRLADEVQRRAETLGGARRLVAVSASNEIEPLLAYLAALHAGHAVVLLPDHPAVVDATTATYDPDVVVARDGQGWRTEHRRSTSAHALHPELALLLSTSGSTGSPKLVRLSHRNLQANAESIAEYLDIRDSDRAMTSLPLHYCYGLSVVHSHLLRGAGVILTERSVVDRCFWEELHRHRATTFAGVPHTFDLLDRVGFEAMSVPSLRYLTQAGGRLAPEKVRRYAELGRRDGWDLFVMYGQTEATARMAYLPPDLAASRPTAIGVPVPGATFEIEPVEGLPDGQGELIYRGPNVMLGYARGPGDLAKGREVEVLRTGDLARRSPDGLYEIVGRRSRFLKLFGLRIDLVRVEEMLDDEGVAAVCTGDDEGLVVARSDAHGEDGHGRIREVIQRDLGLPHSSVDVVGFPELPRLPSGKPDHAAIRRAARAARSPAPAGDARPDARARIRQLFAETLGHPEVTDDSTFVDLGGDSLSYVETSIALEEELGHLPDGWHTTRIRDLADGRRRARRLRRVEVDVLLRAVGITLIVGTHAGLFHVKGGAHVLLAVAGHNFARFQLHATATRGRVISMIESIARIALPGIAWVALLAAVTDDYGAANVLLVHGHVGEAAWSTEWRYWFVEVLVQILVALALLLSVRPVRRVVRRHAYGSAMTALLATLAIRFDLVELGRDAPRIHTVENVAWIFALGWAAHHAHTIGRKLTLSAVVALAVPGSFAGDQRAAAVAVGLLAVLWIRHVPVPRGTTRIVGLLASASLYIYLTHWQIYPTVTDHTHPLLALTASLALGVAAWWIAGHATRLAHRSRWSTTRHETPATWDGSSRPAHDKEENGTGARGRVVLRSPSATAAADLP